MPDLRLLLVLFLLSWPAANAAATHGTWADYRKRFMTADGRVIDTGNSDISHSESQGYGLLLALRHGDRDGFESIRRWTADNLMVRHDGLLAWSWGRRPDGTWAVIDYNNATDGDLLVAWALVEAGKRWQRDDYRTQGQALAREIQRLLKVGHQGNTLLLPGYYGFNQPEGLVLNPAYFVFPAFRALADGGNRNFWKTVERDALDLLEKSFTGPLNLPPDWLLLKDDRIAVFEERSDAFGYEAIRVPLYLALADLKAPARAFGPFLQWIALHDHLPVSVDLVRDRAALADGSAGFYAVMGRCAALVGEHTLSRKLLETAAAKIRNEPQDYYAYTLYLLAQPGGMP